MTPDQLHKRIHTNIHSVHKHKNLPQAQQRSTTHLVQFLWRHVSLAVQRDAGALFHVLVHYQVCFHVGLCACVVVVVRSEGIRVVECEREKEWKNGFRKWQIYCFVTRQGTTACRRRHRLTRALYAQHRQYGRVAHGVEPGVCPCSSHVMFPGCETAFRGMVLQCFVCART